MVYSLTWLPEILDRANLKLSEVAEWRTRGRAEMGRVRGVMIHHTGVNASGNMPTLNSLIKGRSDLRGPLANLGLGRDGTFYVVAAGRANHAGPGVWRGITTGNGSFIGIEVENRGTPDDRYPQEQLDALRRGVAAILKHIGADASMVCGHKEFAPTRKIDPLWDMPAFRESVTALLHNGVPPAPPIPASDDRARPTLRRGARGPVVAVLQAALGIIPTTGNFGPVTEARLREWQRRHALVPDGIAGPKTWAAIDGVDGTLTGAPQSDGLRSLVSEATSNQVAVPVEDIGALPPADDATHRATADGRNAYTPAGTRFARRVGRGFQSLGHTGVDSYVAARPDAGAGLSPSKLRAVVAVMGNEGKLEAVNSYDNSFMSFGIMQWTAGAGDGEGELAALLARLRRLDGEAFDACFGRFGLGASAREGAMYGRLTFEGRVLDAARDKAFLRGPDWAYRFWRAGHHPSVRRCQIMHAGERIGFFAEKEFRGHTVSEWITSELGMTLLLDQHVNRPGHVMPTFEKALASLLDRDGVPGNPGGWSDADEDRLIDLYVAARAKTNMTHAAERATRMFNLADAGRLSLRRGSFR